MSGDVFLELPENQDPKDWLSLGVDPSFGGVDATGVVADDRGGAGSRVGRMGLCRVPAATMA